MSPQFTTSDQDTVLEKAKGIQYVFEARECGPGIMIVYERDDTRERINRYHGLAVNHGWYVASYEPKEKGDVVIIMPFGSGGVPE